MINSNETDRYRVVTAIEAPRDPESRPFDEAAQNLVPDSERPLPGKLGGTATGPRSCSRPWLDASKVILDVAGPQARADRGKVEHRPSNDRRSGRVSRPSPRPRGRSARERHGGHAIHSPADLTTLLGHPDASVRLVVTRWPLWDNPLLWLLLLGLLASEWIPAAREQGLA